MTLFIIIVGIAAWWLIFRQIKARAQRRRTREIDLSLRIAEQSRKSFRKALENSGEPGYSR